MKTVFIIISAVAFNAAGMVVAMIGMSIHQPAISFVGGGMIGLFGIWGGIGLAQFFGGAS